MARSIPLSEHPSNLCKSACLVWTDSTTNRHVYRVAGGYVACTAWQIALEGLFPSETEAREALNDI